MNIIEWLKGVVRNMFSPSTVESALSIQPAVSNKMKNAIELWEDMYQNQSPWLFEDPCTPLRSLNLAATIASEKARTATIEMEVKITDDSERGQYIKEQFQKLLNTLRLNLEYGIALGGLVVKPYVTQGRDNKLRIEFNFVKATDFYPLGFSPEGTLTEAAFISRVITKDKIYSKLEHHKLEGTVLTIQNLAFVTDYKDIQGLEIHNGELGHRVPLNEVQEWANDEEVIIINNIDELLFAYFKMPVANTIDLNSPLGISGFSRAVELIKDADKLYSNLLWEFEGGQLAIDVDRTTLNPTKDGHGEANKNALPKLQQRLFRHDMDYGTDEFYQVFSPALRDASIVNGLNTILMKIEDVCDLSRGTLSNVVYAEARTATELKILKQRSYAANEDIQKELQRCMEHVIRIMDKYCDLYNIVPVGDYEVAYTWDDSIIVDKDLERQGDLLDVDAGLMSRVEYRMKWFGETKEQAEQAIKEIDDEKFANMERQQEVMFQNQQNVLGESNQPKDPKTKGKEKLEERNKKRRSTESKETSK